MPEGQFTGSRATYDYEADDGSIYRLTLDETLGNLTGTGLGKTTTASTSTEIPKRLKPRIVYWQGVLNGRIVRKSLVCNTSGSLYSSSSQDVTIDGVNGSTTGRRGEKFTFTKVIPA